MQNRPVSFNRRDFNTNGKHLIVKTTSSQVFETSVQKLPTVFSRHLPRWSHCTIILGDLAYQFFATWPPSCPQESWVILFWCNCIKGGKKTTSQQWHWTSTLSFIPLGVRLHHKHYLYCLKTTSRGRTRNAAGTWDKQVLPNFHKCFYNSIETWWTYFLSF